MKTDLLGPDTVGKVYFADHIEVFRTLPTESVDLTYIEPPFNTGKAQEWTQLKTVRSEAATPSGFKDAATRVSSSEKSFADVFDDYLGFLEPRLVEAHRVLAPHGCLYIHVDYCPVLYCKVLLEQIFGRACFLNEIIWAYDFSGRSRDRWPPKHDNILCTPSVRGNTCSTQTRSIASLTWL